MSEWVHVNNMSRDELWAATIMMGWMALDLAQHLSFTNNLLALEYRAAAYKKAEKLAYEISNYPFFGFQYKRVLPEGLSIFGKTGLETVCIQEEANDE